MCLQGNLIDIQKKHSQLVTCTKPSDDSARHFKLSSTVKFLHK
jgi:hypothetical protein